MEQVWIPRIGEPSVLEVRHSPDPTPGPGEVRIRVEASGVNFADLMARTGVYPDAPPLPAVVGYEVAGTIDEIGDGVASERQGQPVVAVTPFGGYSSHVIVKDMQAVVRPVGLDASTAAAIPVTGLTAWMMCEEMARVREGDRVLVHSAGGGVGLMVLDLLRMRKAVAVGIASNHKHARLEALGYRELVDGRQQDFEVALADRPRFDAVLDPVGGASWKKSFALLRSGGCLVCYGFSAAVAGRRRSLWNTVRVVAGTPWFMFNPLRVINENKGVFGVNMGRLWGEEDRTARWLNRLVALQREGYLRPQVHARVPFSRAADGHRILHNRENVGKVVLVPDGLFGISSPA